MIGLRGKIKSEWREKELSGGYGYWWTPDIKDCFGSLKPGHFKWLPIDRTIMRNVAHLPMCAKIEVRRPEDPGAVLHEPRHLTLKSGRAMWTASRKHGRAPRSSLSRKRAAPVRIIVFNMVRFTMPSLSV